MSRRNVFSEVGVLHPRRSVFDLSYEKKLTCDMAQLIPVMCDEVVPGDVFKIGNQAVVRFQPLVAPILHEINMYAYYFFVPYRILWDDWEDFISGGVDGQFADPIPEWDPTITTEGSLWDFFGFPVGVDPDGAYPSIFPVVLTISCITSIIAMRIYRLKLLSLMRRYSTDRGRKDYFTSSLPWQQRGTAPALPISGTAHAVFSSGMVSSAGGLNTVQYNSSAGGNNLYGAGINPSNIKAALDRNVVDLSTASTFDIADLRLASQIQVWMERNARAGVRYTEFLRAHFGVSPRDERLQRPEYIGGSKAPCIISEVLQTSSTDSTTPQGNLAGHGITVSDAYCGKYHAQEFGLIIGIMSIMPRSAYSQGIDKQWLRKTKYDFYFPEFANLSEQAILNAEICATGSLSHNQDIFGYQGRYDEMRTKNSQIVSGMRTTFDYWHLGRQFNTGSPPVLNADFIKCTPRKDIFAVPSEPGLIVNFANIIKAFRPLPYMALPGLIDHN